MNGTAYKALGYVVWHGGRWYLRRRLPSARAATAAGVATVTAAAAAARIARRIAG